MQALLLQSPNNWAITEIPVPEIGPDEVLIKVKFAGICNTDLEILDGRDQSSIYKISNCSRTRMVWRSGRMWQQC